MNNEYITLEEMHTNTAGARVAWATLITKRKV